MLSERETSDSSAEWRTWLENTELSVSLFPSVTFSTTQLFFFFCPDSAESSVSPTCSSLCAQTEILLWLPTIDYVASLRTLILLLPSAQFHCFWSVFRARGCEITCVYVEWSDYRTGWAGCSVVRVCAAINNHHWGGSNFWRHGLPNNRAWASLISDGEQSSWGPPTRFLDFQLWDVCLKHRNKIVWLKYKEAQQEEEVQKPTMCLHLRSVYTFIKDTRHVRRFFFLYDIISHICSNLPVTLNTLLSNHHCCEDAPLQWSHKNTF